MKFLKKATATVGLFCLGFGFFPGVAVGQCSLEDADGDHYYADDALGLEGRSDLTGTPCEKKIGIRGYEKRICDCPNLRVGAHCPSMGGVLTDVQIDEVYDVKKYPNAKKGASFNPKATDSPGDGIDHNCDGVDPKVGGGGANPTTIAELIQKGVTILGTVVAGVSTIFLIWGAIMYASAAGEEEKTRKARKTMTGAIVGLVIGVMAATLIGIVIDWVVG